jgi:hypothetical protein
MQERAKRTGFGKRLDKSAVKTVNVAIGYPFRWFSSLTQNNTSFPKERSACRGKYYYVVTNKSVTKRVVTNNVISRE